MQTSFSELEYAAKKKQTRRDRFLAEIELVTPWAKLVSTISPHDPKGQGRGRPPVGVERMLRMYIAQQCFGLSDEGTEDAIYDSQAIRRFVGINRNQEDAPDATTLLKFRRLLEAHDLTESIFAAINAHLTEKGLMLREGTIVDATIIAAPPSTKNRDGERDPEMHQAKKGNQWHFGETDVFGDAGYQGVEKREENQGVPVNWHVAMRPGKRRALPETPLGERQEQFERAKASIRAKVEHPFHVVKNLFRHRKTRYKGLAKNTAQLFTLFGLANLVLARRWLLAPCTPIAS